MLLDDMIILSPYLLLFTHYDSLCKVYNLLYEGTLPRSIVLALLLFLVILPQMHISWKIEALHHGGWFISILSASQPRDPPTAEALQTVVQSTPPDLYPKISKSLPDNCAHRPLFTSHDLTWCLQQILQNIYPA